MKRTIAILSLFVSITPQIASARNVDHHSQRGPPGMLVVDNDRFIPVEVLVDGLELGTVPADSEQAFRLRPGTRSIRVTTRGGNTIVARNVRILPRGSGELDVPAFESKLTVRNRTTVDGILTVNGKRFGELKAGKSAQLIRPPGRVDLELSARGRVIEQTKLSLRSGKKSSWTVDRPILATLLVQNQRNQTVRVLIDGKDRGQIAAGSRRNIELEPGVHRVLVINSNGRVLESERVELSRFETERFSIARQHASNDESEFQGELWELMFDVLFEAMAEESQTEERGRFDHDVRDDYSRHDDESTMSEGHCQEDHNGAWSCSTCSL
jgi:hypothetical protein